MASEEPNSKKQENEDCFINCLPVELIEQIFLTLPVSTLLRCVGVCKKWQNFIKDPLFVTLHLKYAAHFSLIFFGQETVAGKRYPSDAILIDEAWSQSTYAVPTIGPDDILCGSSNGLLCLYRNTSTIKIANLATGECMCLRKPIMNLRGDHFSFYNFGFHPLKKEYKIAHFLSDYIKDLPKKKYECNVIQVYTLGADKWKDIKTPKAFNLNFVRDSGAISVDGTMYWLIEDMTTSWTHAIMSFDPGEECFERIQLPSSEHEYCGIGGLRKYWVREIDGNMCIATAQTCRDDHREIFGKLQIWTFDNKVEKRWSRKYNIDSFRYMMGPNLSHGDKLLKQHSDRHLFYFDLLGNGENPLITKYKMKDILDFSPRKPDNMQSYMCVMSLVSLDVYKKAGIVRRTNKREGWELKKWEAWEKKISEVEEQWNQIYQKAIEINVRHLNSS
jgi:F-box interacting protein